MYKLYSFIFLLSIIIIIYLNYSEDGAYLNRLVNRDYIQLNDPPYTTVCDKNIFGPLKWETLNTPFPIDVVYSWAGEKVSNNIRTSNNNELKYSLRSINKFIPWVNHIYIIVNPGQSKPSWFNHKYSKYITMISESQIFPNSQDVPNKNSNAIECCLHNIPGISEHYIYFCDDFFIGRKLEYTFFFNDNGKAYVSDVIKSKVAMMLKHKKNKLGFKLPPTIPFFYPHIPYTYIKSQSKLFEQKYIEYVNWVRSNKTRIGVGCNMCTDMICPCQQVHGPIHIFMYENGKANIKNYPRSGGGKCSINFLFKVECIHLLDKILIDPPNTFCINDDTKEQSRKYVYDKMLDFFNKMYPELPPWET
jgi:hypothetical protein